MISISFSAFVDVATVVATVALSIIAHGLTANPLAAVFGARAKAESGGSG